MEDSKQNRAYGVTLFFTSSRNMFPWHGCRRLPVRPALAPGWNGGDWRSKICPISRENRANLMHSLHKADIWPAGGTQPEVCIAVHKSTAEPLGSRVARKAEAAEFSYLAIIHGALCRQSGVQLLGCVCLNCSVTRLHISAKQLLYDYRATVCRIAYTRCLGAFSPIL